MRKDSLACLAKIGLAQLLRHVWAKFLRDMESFLAQGASCSVVPPAVGETFPVPHLSGGAGTQVALGCHSAGRLQQKLQSRGARVHSIKVPSDPLWAWSHLLVGDCLLRYQSTLC